MVTIEISCVPLATLLTKAVSASRIRWMRWVAAWLLSTSSAICSGSVAGTIRRISRAALSSRMVMSSGWSVLIGFLSRSSTLT